LNKISIRFLIKAWLTLCLPSLGGAGGGFLPFATLQAQDPVYQHFTKQTGLPSNEVYGIMQDSKGFVWLTTTDGLCRFDGFEYKTFHTKLLSSRGGDQPKKDFLGRIWYMNFDGRLYFIEKNTVYQLPNQGAAYFSRYAIIGKRLWYASIDTLRVFDIENLRLIKKIPAKGVRGLANSSTEFVFAQTNPATTQAELYSINNQFQTQNLHITPEEGYNTLFASDGQRFFHFNKNKKDEQKLEVIAQGKITKTIPLPSGCFVQSVRYTNDSTLWFCTTKGAYCYNTRSFKPLNDGKPYFENRSIAQVLNDAEGNYWFCTTSEGILFVPNFEAKKIENITGIPCRLTLTDNDIYTATKSGAVFKIKNKTPELVLQNSEKTEVLQIFVDAATQHLFYSNNIFNEYSLTQKKTIGTGKQLAIKRLKRIDDKYIAYSASGVCGLMRAETSGLAPTSDWDSIFQKTKRTDALQGFCSIIENIRGKSIAFRKATNTIFYGTNAGIFAVTPKSTTKLTPPDSTFFPQALIDNGDRILGISTQGELFEIDKNNKIQFLNWKTEPIDLIRAYGNNMILMGKRHFYYLDITKNEVPQPLQNTLRTDNANDFLVHNNDFYIATSEGLLYYPFDAIKNNTVKPKLILNYLENGDTQYAPNEIPTFGYNANTVRFNYTILSYRTLARIPLFYRINGKSWRLLPDYTHTLSLDALAPDTYTIDFRFENTNDFQTISFTITPPFWKQLWFILLVMGSLIWTLIEYSRRKIAQDATENKALLERAKLENDLRHSTLTSIKAQMNPHFFYNALNTIQSYIYENDKRNASSFLNKFSKLTRMILEFSERDTISLQEEIDALTLYLDIEAARFDDHDFEYNILVGDSIDIEMLKIPSMIVQPYIENAVKHGLLHKKGFKTLKIRFDRFDNLLYITIDDNGIGRQKSEAINKARHERHQSFATKANFTRIALLNQDSENINVVFEDKIDASEQPLGTTVTLCIRL
jgi:two-component sensor histidine kinase